MKFRSKAREEAAAQIKQEAATQTGDRKRATERIAKRMRDGEIDSYTTADGYVITAD